MKTKLPRQSFTPAPDDTQERPNKRARIAVEAPASLPPASRYLPAVFGGSHWFSKESFQNIIILGDSYSKFDDDKKTWVDHVEKRLLEQNKHTKIHNFAFPGATARDDLSSQLSNFFMDFPKKDSARASPALDADITTYFEYPNRSLCSDINSVVETIFDIVHEFYVKAGARNFVFVDVPPVDRSPQVTDSGTSNEMEERIKTWNELLHTHVTEFSTSSKDATVLLFSSHQVLSEVLQDPTDFDISEDSAMVEGGEIWEDELHLTAHVHDIIAERLLASIFA